MMDLNFACMKESRGNIRSFRFGDQVLKALESMDGDSMNDKFNNLVLYCHEVLPMFEQRIKDAQQRYKQEYDKVLEAQSRLSQIGQIVNTLRSIEYYGQIAERQIKALAAEGSNDHGKV